MKTTIVIPTYWSRPHTESVGKEDLRFDYATPVDGSSVLAASLSYLKQLASKDFYLVILVCPTYAGLETTALERVREIIRESGLDAPTYVIGPTLVREMRFRLVQEELSTRTGEMLEMKSYAQAQNIALLAGHILGTETVCLMGEDVYFKDPAWLDKATEFIGKRIYGSTIYALTAYEEALPTSSSGKNNSESWRTYFNPKEERAKALSQRMGTQTRVQATPFTFGGFMMLHKNLYQTVPFDSAVLRGEGTDYVINAKLFGFEFFLDRELVVSQKPGRIVMPDWKLLYEDGWLFKYLQAKLDAQYPVNNMERLTPDELDPYPGVFLREDLQDRLHKAYMMRATGYLMDGDQAGATACLDSIAQLNQKIEGDPFTSYRLRQKDWAELMDKVAQMRYSLKRLLDGYNLRRTAYRIDYSKYDQISQSILMDNLRRFESFKAWDEADLEALSKITKMRAYNEDDVVFQRGSRSLELHLVVSGSLRVVNTAEDHADVNLARIEAGSLLGETALVKSAYSVTGIANEFTELLVIRREDLEALIEENPVLGNRIWRVLMHCIFKKLNDSNQNYTEKILGDQDVEQ